MPLQNVPNRWNFIAYAAAQGHTVKEIAELAGLSEGSVRHALEDENVIFEVKHIRYKLFGKDTKKKFDEMMPIAQEVTRQILEDDNVKLPLRFAAAQEVFDRALGKPKQTVEHEGSILRSIYEQLSKPAVGDDAIKEVYDVIPALENPERKEKELAAKIPDSIDDWVSKNI